MVAESQNGHGNTVNSLENAVLNQLLHSTQHLTESIDSLWDSYVDPRDAYLGENGEYWQTIGGGGMSPNERLPYTTATQLWAIQDIAFVLWRDNEFAINGHTNRINYIVGESHVYTVVGQGDGVLEEVVKRVQAVLDRILKENKWKRRQKEIKLRDDRDGETFIRKFKCSDGIMRFRFVEPRSIQDSPNATTHQSFGIGTEPHDVESVICYYLTDWDGVSQTSGQWIDASEIQHRKWNVDSSFKRGLPLFYPVRKNLNRAAKLLRNMSTAAEIQTAIALIRKHQQATKDAITQLNVNNRTTSETTIAGKTRSVLQYPSGSILDTPKGTDYTIPPQMDPSKTVTALQAELRAIASRLVMPEFMLTSDASNANFSSTMVAEGPAVKNFESEQDTQIEYDLELINEALAYAADSGLITHEELGQVDVEAMGPEVQVRNRLEEAQIRQFDMAGGILSVQTATAESGRDYQQEQDNISNHLDAGGVPLSPDRPELDGGNLIGQGDGVPDDPSSVSATALNGIQIQSLKDIMIQVSNQEIPEELGKELIYASFPTMDTGRVDRMIQAAKKQRIPSDDNQMQ